MLSPVGTDHGHTVRASLFCAVTLLRHAHYGALQNSAYRDSFSLNSCLGNRCLTLVAWVRANCFQMKVALSPDWRHGQAGGRPKNTPRGGEGNDTLMRCSIQVKKNLGKSL